MLKTVKVTGVVYKQDGKPAAGAQGSARLSVQEIDNGIVVPMVYTFCVEDDGYFEFEVWPNERGTSGSYYSVKIYQKSDTVFDSRIVVPDVDHDLEIKDIINQEPYPPINEGQKAVLEAQKAAMEARGSAEDAESSAVSANESAQASATSASNALTSETNAATSETNAANSGSIASTAATNASNSASQSSTSASASAQSAQDSSDSATESSLSADASAASAEESKLSAESSETSNQSATAQANIATEARDEVVLLKDEILSLDLSAEDSSALSKNWAINMSGLVDNEDYSSKYYANESKEFSEASKSSSDSSETSAVNAKSSEDNALASEQAAKTSETNAKASETAAAASATSASTSETNVAASESVASTKASDASVSATAASSAATTATNKADEASTSATSAATSETNAAASASAASSSADTAQTAASTATTKASEASTSASEASSSAAAASSSADDAASSADEAKDSASAASTSAQEAADNAASVDASVIPMPNRVPKSNDEGLLDDGWMNLAPLRVQVLNALYPNGIYPSLDLRFSGADKINNPNVSFSRVSKATYWDADGVLREADIDEPRFTYDPVSGEAQGLFVEGQATNLFQWSEDFTQEGWNSTSATGTSNGFVLNGSSGRVFRQIPDLSGTFTISVWFSPEDTGKLIRFTVWDDHLDGIGSGRSPALEIPPDGFLSYTWHSLTNARLAGLINGGMPEGTSFSLRENCGIQLEEGSKPSSYIPTEASQVTRAGDFFTLPVGDWYRPDRGTLVVTSATPDGELVAKLGDVEIYSDSNEAKEYRATYNTTNNATELELGVGTFKSIQYYNRVLP